MHNVCSMLIVGQIIKAARDNVLLFYIVLQLLYN